MPQVIHISSQGRGNSPELVILAKREAGLRARSAGVASAAGADTTSLSSLLSSHGAVMHPLFGLSEDRIQAHVEAFIEPLQRDAIPNTQPVLDLPLFYRIAAAEDQLDRLASELLAHDLIEAAYVKPAGAPPTAAAWKTDRSDRGPKSRLVWFVLTNTWMTPARTRPPITYQPDCAATR